MCGTSKFDSMGAMTAKGFVKEYGKAMIWLSLIGFAMTVFVDPPWERGTVAFLKLGFINIVMWVLMWVGNDVTSHLLSERISWTREPMKRFIVGMIVMVGITVTAVLVAAWMYYVLLGMDITRYIVTVLYLSFAISLVISLFLHGRSFLYSWRQEAVNAERLLKEGHRAQYESLRSQVNPHFLFNSLNALTNLVYEDPDKAAKFIKQLSEVYRYVLDTRDKELVPLAEEIKFLESYLFLQRIRFGNKLQVDIALNGEQQVAPLVLQMLIENAIKHNVVSEESPLRIRLFQENGWVIVENNRRTKRTLPEESTGVGLANIRSRYTYFSDKPVHVLSDDEKFTVKLPVISTVQ
jgi:sensor histidine kinase YesM